MSLEKAKELSILFGFAGFIVLMVQGLLILPFKSFLCYFFIYPIIAAFVISIYLLFVPRNKYIDYSTEVRVTDFTIWIQVLFVLICTMSIYQYVSIKSTYTGIDWVLIALVVNIAANSANLLRSKKVFRFKNHR